MKRSMIALGMAALATVGCDPEAAVLVEGARLHSANGMFFDLQGRLNVASVLGNEIVQLDPGTGVVLGRLGLSEGVDGPDDLTIGPDGSLYWTSLVSGQVGRRQPSGATTFQQVAPGVNPITFSDDGRLFVALDFLGDALYELDPDLALPPRLIAQNLGFLNGMDFGPDGRLYGPIFTQGRVVSIDVDSCEGATDPYAECDIQTVADGFFVPAAVKFDALVRLHVVDQSGEVFRVDTATGAKQVIAVLPPGLDNLAFHPATNHLYVSSANDGFVVRVRADGTTQTLSPGGMIAPGGVAVLGAAGQESVFVADVLTLREFDGETGAQLSQVANVLGSSELTTPTNVSADGANLILSSWFGNAVQVWDPAAQQVLESYADFLQPISALRFEGDLVVAEGGFASGQGRVVRQTSGGRVTLADALGLPSGLAAAGGDLWFADWEAGAVYQVIDDGAHLPAPVLVAGGLEGPEGLAVDLHGGLLVVEASAGRLSRIDPATGAVTELVSGLATGLAPFTGAPPLYVFSGVTVGPSGAVYVTGDLDNVLYRL